MVAVGPVWLLREITHLQPPPVQQGCRVEVSGEAPQMQEVLLFMEEGAEDVFIPHQLRGQKVVYLHTEEEAEVRGTQVPLPHKQ